MKSKEIRFILPLGFEDDDGVFHREGAMKLATALDELEIHGDERSLYHKRYRDCILLSKVVTKLGEISTITPEMIENLFEVDFIYLQMLYNKLNRDYEVSVETLCPSCSASNKIALPDMYAEMHRYFEEKKTEG